MTTEKQSTTFLAVQTVLLYVSYEVSKRSVLKQNVDIKSKNESWTSAHPDKSVKISKTKHQQVALS